jgi:hypothetical protein
MARRKAAILQESSVKKSMDIDDDEERSAIALIERYFAAMAELQACDEDSIEMLHHELVQELGLGRNPWIRSHVL